MWFRPPPSAGHVTLPEPLPTLPAPVEIPRQRTADGQATPSADEQATPSAYGGGVPSPWYPGPRLPPQPRRSYLWPALASLLVLSMLVALAGAGATAWVLRG